MGADRVIFCASAHELTLTRFFYQPFVFI